MADMSANSSNPPLFAVILYLSLVFIIIAWREHKLVLYFTFKNMFLKDAFEFIDWTFKKTFFYTSFMTGVQNYYLHNYISEK